eukprot:3820313-Rhodomonas_salina.1
MVSRVCFAIPGTEISRGVLHCEIKHKESRDQRIVYAACGYCLFISALGCTRKMQQLVTLAPTINQVRSYKVSNQGNFLYLILGGSLHHDLHIKLPDRHMSGTDSAVPTLAAGWEASVSYEVMRASVARAGA